MVRSCPINPVSIIQPVAPLSRMTWRTRTGFHAVHRRGSDRNHSAPAIIRMLRSPSCARATLLNYVVVQAGNSESRRRPSTQSAPQSPSSTIRSAIKLKIRPVRWESARIAGGVGNDSLAFTSVKKRVISSLLCRPSQVSSRLFSRFNESERAVSSVPFAARRASLGLNSGLGASILE